MNIFSISRSRRGAAAVLLATVALLPTGCTILTKSQREAVADFSKAASNYGTLPGEPIRAYGQATRFDRLLNVSARDFQVEAARVNAWDEIGKALQANARFGEAAKQADAALDVLDDYVAVLGLLASDEFTTALEKSAKDLGSSVDKGIKAYNKNFLPAGQKELALVGSTVAAAVRGAGGIYLRYRQAKLLRACVLAGNEVVERLTADIVTLMRGKMIPYLTEANARLGDDFKNAARQARDLPLSTIQEVAAQVERTGNAQKLAEAAAKSAESLAKAHQELAKELTSRKKLKDRIEQIQVLADEIKAAQKLKKSLEK